MQETVFKIKREIIRLQAALSPWVGMTIQEARKHGWGKEQDEQQGRLWQAGYLLTAYKRAEAK